MEYPGILLEALNIHAVWPSVPLFSESQSYGAACSQSSELPFLGRRGSTLSVIGEQMGTRLQSVDRPVEPMRLHDETTSGGAPAICIKVLHRLRVEVVRSQASMCIGSDGEHRWPAENSASVDIVAYKVRPDTQNTSTLAWFDVPGGALCQRQVQV